MPYPNNLLNKYQVLEKPNEALQRNVLNIVASYNSAWDPLTELIQNSIDAINQRAAKETGDFRGRLIISIDANAKTIMVEDNGLGIPPRNAGTMILPGGSLKTTGSTYGHKGLGFTYCAHIAESIEIETEEYESHQKEHWQFSGGYKWLTDSAESPSLDDQVSRPVRSDSISGPGTTVKLCLAIGEYEKNIANTSVLDDFFSWADDEKLLPFVLRTRTAIGQVGSLFGQSSPVDVEIQVKLVNSQREFSVPYTFFDFRNLPPFNQQNFPAAIDYATQIYLNSLFPNKTHYGIFHVFSNDSANPTQPLKVGKNRGGVSFKVYVFACGKENLASALQSYDQRLGSHFRYLAFTTDVHLAIDGMPCGVPIDSWNNFGAHEQRYFAIVDTELRFGTVLDAGRKTITRYYVDLIVDKIIKMTKEENYFSGQTSFYAMSTQLHTRVSYPARRTPMQYITKWEGLPDLASAKLILNKEPDDELGAYLLFGELVGRGHIPGYKIKYISGGAIYDAAFEFEIGLEDRASLNQTAGGTAKYGVGQALVQQQRSTPQFPTYKWSNPATGQTHLVTEFKVTAEELLQDIQKHKSEKQLQHIDILICISYHEQAIRNLQGVVVPVQDAARRLPGVTHELSFAGHTTQVICLKEVIAELEGCGQI